MMGAKHDGCKTMMGDFTDVGRDSYLAAENARLKRDAVTVNQ